MSPKKPTAKQKRDWQLVNDTMTTTLAAGVKVLQDEFGMSDKSSGLWAIHTAIMLNDALDIPTDALHALAMKYKDELAA